MPHDNTGKFDFTQAADLRSAVEQAMQDLYAIADNADTSHSETGDECGRIADYLAQHLA